MFLKIAFQNNFFKTSLNQQSTYQHCIIYFFSISTRISLLLCSELVLSLILFQDSQKMKWNSFQNFMCFSPPKIIYSVRYSMLIWNSKYYSYVIYYESTDGYIWVGLLSHIFWAMQIMMNTRDNWISNYCQFSPEHNVIQSTFF